MTHSQIEFPRQAGENVCVCECAENCEACAWIEIEKGTQILCPMPVNKICRSHTIPGHDNKGLLNLPVQSMVCAKFRGGVDNAIW
jgi:hypothetical protein